jgi:K+-sensing histidine kinase KdpD
MPVREQAQGVIDPGESFGAMVEHALHILPYALALVLSVMAVGTGLLYWVRRGSLTTMALVCLLVLLVTLPVTLLLGRAIARRSVWEREARERERAAEASRRELVAWISHDLRTPLALCRCRSRWLATRAGSAARPVVCRGWSMISSSCRGSRPGRSS